MHTHFLSCIGYTLPSLCNKTLRGVDLLVFCLLFSNLNTVVYSILHYTVIKMVKLIYVLIGVSLRPSSVPLRRRAPTF